MEERKGSDILADGAEERKMHGYVRRRNHGLNCDGATCRDVGQLRSHGLHARHVPDGRQTYRYPSRTCKCNGRQRSYITSDPSRHLRKQGIRDVNEPIQYIMPVICWLQSVNPSSCRTHREENRGQKGLIRHHPYPDTLQRAAGLDIR